MTRSAFAVLPVLALLALPGLASAATQVSVTKIQGLDVVVAADDDSAGQIETVQGIDSGTSQHFVAVQSAGGVGAGAGCSAVTATVAACAGDFDAVLVFGNGGNDQITLKLIADGLPPLHGEAYGDAGDDVLKSPPDGRNVPQPETYMEGGPGNDTIVSGNGPDELHGGDGNDTMQSFSGADFVYGEGGDDSVSAGKEEPAANAADVIDGGPGFDSIPDVDADYNRGFDDNVSVTLDGQANDGEAAEGDNVVGVEKLRITANLATFVGSDAAEDVFIEANGSVVRGLGGNDRLVTYDGNDTIEGGDGDDYLEGGFGNDVLDGGAGVDGFNGDRTESNVFAVGNDTIRARDGNVEQVSCGLGADSALVDVADVVDPSCESVDRGQIVADQPPLKPGFGAKTKVTLGLVAVRMPAGGALKVRIANANGFAVTGVVSGRSTKKVTVSVKRHVALKAKSFTVAANGRKTVSLSLPKPLRRALKRSGAVSLRLTVRVKDPAGNTQVVTAVVKPKLKRRAR